MDVVVHEVAAHALARVSATIVGDPEGMAEFGGFYGRAEERLAPLLDPRRRRAFVVVVDGSDAGFLDTELTGVGPAAGQVGLSWFVRGPWRGRGVTRAALQALERLAPYPAATSWVAVIDPANAASRSTARRSGFVLDGVDADGEERWVRPLAHPATGQDVSAGSR